MKKMNQKTKKLTLTKSTISNLDFNVIDDLNVLCRIKGGTVDPDPAGKSESPKFCHSIGNIACKYEALV